MHDKFAVIDEAVVLTGSFNWTSQAVKYNQENILFIQNDELAKKYMDEFNKLWMGYGKVISYEDAKKMMAD